MVSSLPFLNLPNLFFALGLIGINRWLAGFKHADESTKRVLRYALAIGLWLDEILWHHWNWQHGFWSVQTMLPLHVCSLMIWLAGFMLIFKSYRIFEYAYFWGLGGAAQVLLTSFGPVEIFSQYRYFQIFISHGLLITAVIYMIVVERLRPTWASFRRVVVGMFFYTLVIFPLNFLLGSNYMFLVYKPTEFASLLNLLPPWPYYIPYMEVLGILVFLLLYLPYALKDQKESSQPIQSA